MERAPRIRLAGLHGPHRGCGSKRFASTIPVQNGDEGAATDMLRFKRSNFHRGRWLGAVPAAFVEAAKKFLRSSPAWGRSRFIFV